MWINPGMRLIKLFGNKIVDMRPLHNLLVGLDFIMMSTILLIKTVEFINRMSGLNGVKKNRD